MHHFTVWFLVTVFVDAFSSWKLLAVNPNFNLDFCGKSPNIASVPNGLG
jgi:hypothetical protein